MQSTLNSSYHTPYLNTHNTSLDAESPLHLSVSTPPNKGKKNPSFLEGSLKTTPVNSIKSDFRRDSFEENHEKPEEEEKGAFRKRTWSADNESDKMFRDILVSSLKKDKKAPEFTFSTEKNDFDENDEFRLNEFEMQTHMMLDKLLDSEDI